MASVVVGAGVVAGALGGDAQAALAGELDDGDDVVGGRGDGDRGGALVDGEVPGLAGLVPVGVAGGADAALHAVAELSGVNAGGIGDEHAAMLRGGGCERIGDIPSPRFAKRAIASCASGVGKRSMHVWVSRAIASGSRSPKRSLSIRLVRATAARVVRSKTRTQSAMPASRSSTTSLKKPWRSHPARGLELRR